MMSPAGAELFVREYVPGSGEFVTFDDVSGYHWYWNLPDFSYMTYDEQMDEIADLDPYGHIAGGWHMASRSEMDTLWANSPESVTASFAKTYDDPDPDEDDLWMGRYNDPYPPITGHFVGGGRRYPDGTAQLFTLGSIAIEDGDDAQPYGAWVVTNQAVIPAPGALILAATGLLSSTLGLHRLRRRH